MRPTILLAAALALSGLAVAPASAATTFTRLSLDATVDDASVTVTAVVSDEADDTVQQYAICARTSTGANVDFSPKARDLTITRNGTSITRTKTFGPGTYSYWPCIQDDGHWVTVGATKRFTVDDGSGADAGKKILFEDDFDGSSGSGFSTARWGEWSACSYNGSAAYGNIDCGADETLDGAGHLKIPADPNHGSSISTKDDFTFVYGEASAWVKTPPQVGYWPAFWTLNNNADGHDTLPLGEADVLESYTTWPTIYHRGTHNWNGSKTWGSPGDPYCGNVDLSAAFHKYTARFEPGKITFLFDDKVCGAVTSKADGNGQPYGFGPDVTRGNWLILTLAVGGAGGQQKPATSAATMLVDRVEVRAL